MEISDQEKQQPKMPKLQAFKTLRAKLALAGIEPTLATQSYPLNGRICICFLVLSLGISFICVFIFSYAETFSEYAQPNYMVSAALFVAIALVNLILNVNKMYEFINRCDVFINMGE